MPDWLVITLIIIGGLLSLYIIFAIVCLVFSKIFSIKIKFSNNALNVLLHQRHEFALKIILLLEDNGIEVTKESKKAIEKLERIDDFQTLEKNDRNDRISVFSHEMADLILTVKANSEKIGEDVVNKMVKEFRDLEDDYRQKSSVYNADVIGYNYWINALLVRWISKLFRRHKKDIVL